MLNPEKMTGTDLAYLGDAVMELMTREKLLATGITDVGRLNKLALSYVRATAQSEAVERVLPLLTDEEAEVFKRGRNAHGISAPKSASTADYRRATGLEALFAYLWLKGEDDRRRELFAAAYPEKPEET
ncbi:MAG: ribonuclease III [Lachnospiraceae bacterium]|nr:ribonuclease III [Lachnospiraceae bacterium]